MTPTTNIIDLELSDDELDHVCGGFTSSEHSTFEAPAPPPKAPSASGGGIMYIEIAIPALPHL